MRTLNKELILQWITGHGVSLGACKSGMHIQLCSQFTMRVSEDVKGLGLWIHMDQDKVSTHTFYNKDHLRKGRQDEGGGGLMQRHA